MNDRIGTHSYQRGSGFGRYEYIINQDQLIKAFNDSRNNLNYALLKESNRQRFLIANSQGLKEKFIDVINRDLKHATDDIEKSIATDIYNYTMQLFNNGTMNGSSSLNLGSALGRAIGNGIVAIAEEIWKNEDRDYR